LFCKSEFTQIAAAPPIYIFIYEDRFGRRDPWKKDCSTSERAQIETSPSSAALRATIARPRNSWPVRQKRDAARTLNNLAGLTFGRRPKKVTVKIDYAFSYVLHKFAGPACDWGRSRAQGWTLSINSQSNAASGAHKSGSLDFLSNFFLCVTSRRFLLNSGPAPNCAHPKSSLLVSAGEHTIFCTKSATVFLLAAYRIPLAAVSSAINYTQTQQAEIHLHSICDRNFVFSGTLKTNA